MADAPRSRRPRCFEDYAAGDEIEFGAYEVTEQELLEFARRYDPQPFHIDKDAAARSPYGGLITSGWHTCSMLMRMMVDHYIDYDSGLGSPGVEEVRWIEPVRPGDVLGARITVLETRASKSRPELGIVRSQAAVTRQDGTVVMTLKSTGFVLRRAALDARG